MIGLVFLVCLIVIIALIVVLAKLSEITSRINVLEARVAHLVRELAERQPPAQEAVPSVVPRETVATPVVPASAIPMPPVTTPGPVHPAPPLFSSAPTPPSRTREEWEALIGGKLLNRIGALALVIGIGFFLKYAFDNNWLSETVRVLLGAVAGILLLAGAARSRSKGLVIFAQGLVGAGIAVLYLSVYASFNYYQLVSQPVAFVLMAAVTIIAFTQAFLYDSIVVSLLGWAGGFLTPFMLSTGEANEIGLFSYIALLAAGLLVVVMKKERWAILDPLTLAATYSIFYLWYGQEYRPESFAPTLFFALIFWGLFFVVDVVNSLRRIEVLKELRDVAAAFNAALFYLALWLLIDEPHHAWMGGTTLALGAVYLVTALAVRQANPQATGNFARLMCTAIILMVLAPFIEYTRFTVIMWWSAEATILAASAWRWNLRFTTISAVTLFALTTIGLLGTEGALLQPTIETYSVLLNMRAAAFLVLVLSLALSGYLLAKIPAPPSGKPMETARAQISAAFSYGCCFLLFVLITVETNDFFRHLMAGRSGLDLNVLSFHRYIAEAVAWSVLGLILVWATSRQPHRRPLLYSGIVVTFLAMAMAAIRGIAFVPVERFTLLLNDRFVGLLVVIAAAYVVAALLRKSGHIDWSKESAEAIGVFSVILILVLLTGETRDAFEKKLLFLNSPESDGSASITTIENLKQLSLSGVWLLYSISLMGIGIWRRVRSLRVMAIALFGATILKIFIYDLSFLETLYRIFSFIGLGVVLLVVSYLYQHYKDVIFLEHPEEEAETEETTA